MTNLNATQTDPNTAQLAILAPHADHLIRMKAQGKSAVDMLAWLRQGLNQLHGGHLAAFWKHHEESTRRPESPLRPSSRLPEDPAAGKSSPRSSATPSTGNAASGPDGVEPASPVPPGSVSHLNSRFASLARQLLESQSEALQNGAAPDPQILKQINAMMQTINQHDYHQAQLALRERALKLKEAEYKLKTKKLAHDQARTGLRRKEVQAGGQAEQAARNFDNSGRIATLRREFFPELYDEDYTAQVAAAIATAEAGGIGTLARPYTPPNHRSATSQDPKVTPTSPPPP